MASQGMSLPLRCRREDRSVGEREGKFYRVCVCVLLILLAVNHYVILIHYSHSHFHSSEVGIRSRVSFLLLRP